MRIPSPAHTVDTTSQQHLAKVIARVASAIDAGPLRSSDLAAIMREMFHGRDADGIWSWRMAYDVMQAAAIDLILKGKVPGPPEVFAAALSSQLLTETRRSEQQIRLQQFSTPLPYAALVVHAASIRTGETVLEPSAGTGSLAAFARLAGGVPMLNEIDPWRLKLLEILFKTNATAHDGEHIDDLLRDPRQPTAIVMNPPFSSSLDRAHDPHIAAKHLISALKRLAPGGRLAAIMPLSFAPKRAGAYWTRACGIAQPLLRVTIPGHVYRKLGTSVETQIVVFDKIAEAAAHHQATARDLTEAADIIENHLPKRTHASSQSTTVTHSSARANQPQARKSQAVQRKTPIAARTKLQQTNALVPLAFTPQAAPRENTPVSDIYARYRPLRPRTTRQVALNCLDA